MSYRNAVATVVGLAGRGVLQTAPHKKIRLQPYTHMSDWLTNYNIYGIYKKTVKNRKVSQNEAKEWKLVMRFGCFAAVNGVITCRPSHQG